MAYGNPQWRIGILNGIEESSMAERNLQMAHLGIQNRSETGRKRKAPSCPECLASTLCRLCAKQCTICETRRRVTQCGAQCQVHNLRCAIVQRRAHCVHCAGSCSQQLRDTGSWLAVWRGVVLVLLFLTRTSLSRGKPCEACWRQHGRDAKGQKQHPWAEGQLSHSHLPKQVLPFVCGQAMWKISS